MRHFHTLSGTRRYIQPLSASAATVVPTMEVVTNTRRKADTLAVGTHFSLLVRGAFLDATPGTYLSDAQSVVTVPCGDERPPLRIVPEPGKPCVLTVVVTTDKTHRSVLRFDQKTGVYGHVTVHMEHDGDTSVAVTVGRHRPSESTTTADDGSPAKKVRVSAPPPKPKPLDATVEAAEERLHVWTKQIAAPEQLSVRHSFHVGQTPVNPMMLRPGIYSSDSNDGVIRIPMQGVDTVLECHTGLDSVMVQVSPSCYYASFVRRGSAAFTHAGRATDVVFYLAGCGRSKTIAVVSGRS